MSRILGIDLGSKKSGVAISDASRLIAFTKAIIYGDIQSKQIAELTSIVDSENIEAIVFGLPSMEGEWRQTIITSANILEKELAQRKLQCSIVFQDEDYSTKDAQNNLKEIRSSLKRKDRESFNDEDDAEAARILLQRYLDQC